MPHQKVVTDRFKEAVPIRFPDKVKCSLCERNLMAEKFSNKQKQLYVNTLRESKGKPVSLFKHPKCTKCTGQQNVEMTCKFCDVTKGLEDFAKNQRNNPDNARCWDCSATHLEELPGEVAVEAEQLKESGVGTSAYTRTWTMQLSNPSNKLSLSETNSIAGSRGSSAFAEVDEEDDYDDANDAVWVSQGKAPISSQTGPRLPASFTGYDITGSAHHRQRAPSIAPSATSTEWDNFSAVDRPSSHRSYHAGSIDSNSDRFAKIPAVTPSTKDINDAREEREARAEANRNDAVGAEDDDSDSDEELPY